MGRKETVKDTARVLGRMYDAIEYRGFGQEVAEELAEYAGVPVYNGLTDDWHPTQILGDFLTFREHAGRLKDPGRQDFIAGHRSLGSGRFGSYRRSSGLLHGTRSPASTTRRVFDVPSGKSAARFSPSRPSKAAPLPTNTWQPVW